MTEIAWRPTPNGKEILQRKSDGTFVVVTFVGAHGIGQDVSQQDALIFFKTWPTEVSLRVVLEDLNALGLTPWEIDLVIGHTMQHLYGTIENRRILRGEHSQVPNKWL